MGSGALVELRAEGQVFDLQRQVRGHPGVPRLPVGLQVAALPDAGEHLLQWPEAPKPKPAYKFVLPDEGLFAFAGIWEEWQKGDQPPLRTVSMVTTEPNDLVRHFHHRMGVILSPDLYTAWLDPTMPPELLLQMLRPYPYDLLAYPVGTHVNDPKHQGPKCAEAIGPAVTRPADLRAAG
jgi:hypothetical protein